MLDDDPENHPSYKRAAHNSPFLIGLIAVAAVVVLLQYTSYAILPTEKTSTLWGVLTGLVIGGFIFGWLKLG